LLCEVVGSRTVEREGDGQGLFLALGTGEVVRQSFVSSFRRVERDLRRGWVRKDEKDEQRKSKNNNTGMR